RPDTVRDRRAGERAGGRCGRARGEVGPAEADPGRRVHVRAPGGAARRAGGRGRLAGAGPRERAGRRRGAPGGGGGGNSRGGAEAEKAQFGEAKARAEAERRREVFESLDYGRRIEVAHQEWREGNLAATVALLDGIRADLRGWEWYYVHHLCHTDLLTLKGHTD